MERAVNSEAELYIENQRLVQMLQNDLKRYDVVYIHAPSGWGKYTFLKYYKENLETECLWIETEEELYAVGQEYPDGECVFIIPRLEFFLQRRMHEQLWRMLTEKSRYQKFIIGSAVPLPDELLLFSASRKLIVYGENELRPCQEDVAAYYSKRGIAVSKEELMKIENDFHNMPLCLYLLENPLRHSRRGYCKTVREQCLEDVYRYIDITFFRTFTIQEQTALLKLSCFDTLTIELISFVLHITEDAAEELVKYLNLRGSVLKSQEQESWCFYELFHRFLNRMLSKYLDISELMTLYQGSMEYFQKKNQYIEALRFAGLLEDEEKMAEYLDRYLQENISYEVILSMETYFMQISFAYLMEYPRLLTAAALLEAMNVDRERAGYYVRLLNQCLNDSVDPRKKEEIERCLVCLHLSMPGAFDLQQFDHTIEILEKHQQGIISDWHKLMMSNHLSLLHGDKDYCVFMCEKLENLQTHDKVETLLKGALGEQVLGYLYYLYAEVQYECNHLDEALRMLSVSRTHARRKKDQNLMTMCSIKIGDILIIRNQTEKVNDFSGYHLEESAKKSAFFMDNLYAHQIDYDLLENDEKSIRKWMSEKAPDENGWFRSTQYYTYLMKAKVYIWDGKNILARMILDMLWEYAQSFDRYYLKIQVKLLEAISLYMEENDQWSTSLKIALEQAEKYGFVRVIADEGAAVYDMLQSYADLNEEFTRCDYFKEVLKESRTQMLLYPDFMKKKRSLEAKQFSTYEKDIMKLLIQGEKNADIARKLCVSENTVKYHLKNIYQKLDVKSRSQAVHRVKELKLF